MGARRLTVKKKKSAVLPAWQGPTWVTRRLLGGAILLIGVAGVFGFSTWHLLQSDTLPIDRVQVKGSFQYLVKQDLYDAIGDLSNNGFFSVDVRAVKLAAESLAWVDRASVRRIWPNILQVEIVEQVPLAKWKDGRVVNRRGEVIDVEDGSQLSALPIFSGPEGSSEMLAKRFQVMSEKLTQVKLGVVALNMNERRAWRVSLNNGLQLLLGRQSNETQLGRFVDAYKTVLADKVEKIQSIDLRYTNGFSVSWRPVVG